MQQTNPNNNIIQGGTSPNPIVISEVKLTYRVATVVSQNVNDFMNNVLNSSNNPNVINNRYLLITSPADLNTYMQYFTQIHYNTCAYILKNFHLLVYADYSYIRNEDAVLIYLNNFTDDTPGFDTNLIAVTNQLYGFGITVFTQIRNVSSANPALYPPVLRDYIVMCYGYLRTSDNRTIWSAGDFIRMMGFALDRTAVFCNFLYKTPLDFEYMSSSQVNTLLSSKVNAVFTKILRLPVAISGNTVIDIIYYNYLVYNIQKTLKSFIGYPNIQEVRYIASGAVRQLLSNMFDPSCSNVQYRIICDETNNNDNSPIMVMEIQFDGAYDRSKVRINRIVVTQNLTP